MKITMYLSTLKRRYIIGVFSLLLMILVLPLTIFISQKQQDYRQHAAGTMNFPTDGEGLYEECRPSEGQSCYDHLSQMANAGFKLVLNYDGLYGNAASIMAYADHAQTLGMKVIWSLHDQRIYAGNLTSTYPEIAGSFGCSDWPTFIKYFVNLVKNQPATWGYSIGDEVDPADHAQLKAFSDVVHQADPNHPRLFIGSATGNSQTWSGTSPFYDTTDVIGDDFYPTGYVGNLPRTATIAQGTQTYADKYGIGSAMVLQSFNQNEYQSTTQICQPWPSCQTLPTEQQMQEQLTLTLQNMHPRLILWYSYFDIMRSDNPTQHWNDLLTAVKAVGIMISPTITATLTPTVPIELTT